MSPSDADVIYELLLKRYVEQGFLNPKLALDSGITRLLEIGRTREEAIRELHSSGSPWTYSPTIPPIDSQEEKNAEQEKAVTGQIANLREKIDSLTTLFSKGEITQETYVSGVKKIEEDIRRLRGEKRMPTVAKQNLPRTGVWGTARHEALDESEYRYHVSSTSWAWYLIPFFFGILGGIIGYVAVKNDDQEMANNLLVFGFLWTFALGFLWLLFMH